MENFHELVVARPRFFRVDGEFPSSLSPALCHRPGRDGRAVFIVAAAV